VKGVKSENRPTYREKPFIFDKSKPISEHNFPITKYTNWEIYGYRKDKLTGIKTPYWLNKVLPTGRPLTPQLVGLDGFFTVKPTEQIM
jgi:hypothetical protein